MSESRTNEERKTFTGLSEDYLRESEKVATSLKDFEKYNLPEDKKRHLPEITRNLSVIFGFFFVFLSAILGLLPYLVSLQESVRLVFYVVIWMFSFSMFLIGIELLRCFMRLQIENCGKLGFWFLVLIAMVAYLGFVGLLVAGDILFFGISVSLIGLLAFLVIELLLLAFISLKTRKVTADCNRFDALIEEFEQKKKSFVESVIELMREIDDAQRMEELIGFCTNISKCYRNPSFQKEVADVLLRFRKHRGIIEEVGRCSALLDNYEIRHALREASM